jgi:hypothetical protein
MVTRPSVDPFAEFKSGARQIGSALDLLLGRYTKPAPSRPRLRPVGRACRRAGAALDRAAQVVEYALADGANLLDHLAAELDPAGEHHTHTFTPPTGGAVVYRDDAVDWQAGTPSDEVARRAEVVHDGTGFPPTNREDTHGKD